MAVSLNWLRSGHRMPLTPKATRPWNCKGTCLSETYSMTVKSRLLLLIANAALGISILLGLLVRDITSVFNAAGFAEVNTVPSLQNLGTGVSMVAEMRVLTWKHIAST